MKKYGNRILDIEFKKRIPRKHKKQFKKEYLKHNFIIGYELKILRMNTKHIVTKYITIPSYLDSF